MPRGVGARSRRCDPVVWPGRSTWGRIAARARHVGFTTASRSNSSSHRPSWSQPRGISGSQAPPVVKRRGRTGSASGSKRRLGRSGDLDDDEIRGDCRQSVELAAQLVDYWMEEAKVIHVIYQIWADGFLAHRRAARARTNRRRELARLRAARISRRASVRGVATVEELAGQAGAPARFAGTDRRALADRTRCANGVSCSRGADFRRASSASSRGAGEDKVVDAYAPRGAIPR